MDTEPLGNLDLADFRSIIASSVDGFLLVDLSGHILEANESYCQLTGYSRDELLNRHISEVDPIDSVDDVARRSEKIIQAGSLRFETRHRHKNGTAVDVEVSSNYSPLHGGSFFSFFRDITQQKRIEQDHRKSEALYRNIVENQTEFVDRYLPGGILTYVNAALVTFAGVKEEELLGASFYPFIDEADREEAVRQIESISRENPIVKTESRIVLPDGRLRWNSWTHTGFFDESGAIVEYQSVGRDITERKQVEQALKESEERFRNLLQEVPSVAVQGYGPDGTTQYWNQASEKLYGYSAEEAIGRNLLDLIIPPEMRRDVEEAIRYMAETGQSIPAAELSLMRKDGSLVPVFSSHAIVNVPGRPQELFCLDIDLTERKQAEQEKLALEQQFQQTQKLESLGVLAGGIAHDFNNILAIIMGYCSLIKMNYESAEKNIPQIEKAAERAAELCRQMLAYAGKTQFVQTQVNMGALVNDMVNMLQATINQNVVIKLSLADEKSVISADASQIRQIIMNLIINASEAIGDLQGTIDVSLARITITTEQAEKDTLGKAIPAGAYTCLQVTDNGCGMDDEAMRRIFEPFYTTKFTGRGLGLSAVLGILTAHKGALQLYSQPGKGTTFKVYLPVEPGDSSGDQLHQQLTTAETWQGSGTVLLVEDEELIMEIAKTMLEELGFTVIEAANGKEALELYQKNAVDISLVMTDLGMPVMDGYALFSALKELQPALPIIISSGFGDASVTSRIDPKQIAGLVTKPYRFDTLREMLKNICSG